MRTGVINSGMIKHGPVKLDGFVANFTVLKAGYYLGGSHDIRNELRSAKIGWRRAKQRLKNEAQRLEELHHGARAPDTGTE